MRYAAVRGDSNDEIREDTDCAKRFFTYVVPDQKTMGHHTRYSSVSRISQMRQLNKGWSALVEPIGMCAVYKTHTPKPIPSAVRALLTRSTQR